MGTITNRTLLIFCVFALTACSKNSDKSEAAQARPDIIVQNNRTAANCSWGNARYRCDLDATSPDGPGSLQMDIVLKKSRGNRRTVQIQTYEYVADGKVHEDSSDYGARFHYSVSCTQDGVKVDVRALDKGMAMTMSVTSFRSSQPTATAYIFDSTGETQGSGSCIRQ